MRHLQILFDAEIQMRDGGRGLTLPLSLLAFNNGLLRISCINQNGD